VKLVATDSVAFPFFSVESLFKEDELSKNELVPIVLKQDGKVFRPLCW
jgi:hypothetical protein